MARSTSSETIHASVAPAADPVVQIHSDEGLDLRELIDLLLRGKWIILATAALLVVPTVIYNALQPSIYQSTSTLLIQKDQASLQGVLPGANQFYQSYDDLANEILILRQSMPLAERTAEMLLQLRRAPGTSVPLSILAPNSDGSDPTVQQVAFRLQGGYISASVVEGGGTAVRVAATSTDPAEAEVIANVYADAFVALTLGQSQSGITQSREFLEERLQDQGEELRRRDAALQSFVESEGAVALEQETNQAVTQAGQLDGEIGALDVEVQTQQERLRTLRSQLDRLEPLLSQRLGSGLDADLAAAQTRVQALNAELEKIYNRTPAYRTAPSSADPELGRLRGELEQAQESARDVAARLTRQSVASGTGPGDQGAGFNRVASLRIQISEAEVELNGARARRTQLARQLADAEQELEQIPAQSIALAQLQRGRQAAEQLYGALQTNYQEAQVAEESQIGIGRVLRPAYASSQPIAPNRVRSALMALIAGLGVGGLFAVAKVKLDHRIHVPDDITSLGYPLIGIIPDTNDLIKKDFGGADTTQVSGREIDTHLVTLLNPMATASESYRALRTSVQFSRPDVVVQTILVTSANPSEGKSTTAANLGIVLAQAGRRVLLVDADLRRPTIHRKLGLPREPGLVQELFEDAPFDPASIPSVAENLYVLTAGSIAPNPSELVGSKRMRDVIDQMRGSFDVILFDAPPVLAATDAVLLSTQCDATLVVCKAGSTKDFDLDAAYDALQGVGASIIGTVLNGFDVSQSYGYKYKYAYRYGNDYAYGTSAS